MLLANQGILPLAPGRRIALAGPRSHEASAMFGCYAFPQHVGVHHPGLPLGVEVPTVLDALRADPARYAVRYAEGCPVLGGGDAGTAAAAAVASAADVCVAVLGDQAGLFGRAPQVRAATRPTCAARPPGGTARGAPGYRHAGGAGPAGGPALRLSRQAAGRGGVGSTPARRARPRWRTS